MSDLMEAMEKAVREAAYEDVIVERIKVTLNVLEARGYAVVPVEPTEEMLAEGKFIRMTKPKMEWSVADVWREMVAARPKVTP